MSINDSILKTTMIFYYINNIDIPCVFLGLRSFTTGSSRILSPIAFFHDGIPINDMTLGHNMIGTHRRAQAIATAPRRNRYEDDDNDHGSNNSKYSYNNVIILLF